MWFSARYLQIEMNDPHVRCGSNERNRSRGRALGLATQPKRIAQRGVLS
jgi:hypothetical protein